MILQALCEYYDRKQADLPPFGFEEKPIPFIIVIDNEGKFVNLENNCELENKKLIPKPLRVPKASVRTGQKSFETANCLWDHFGYIVAQPRITKPDDIPKPKDIETAQKQHHSFKKLVGEAALDLPTDIGVNAVNNFLNSQDEIERLKSSDNWQECLKIKGCNLTFRLAGETYIVCQSKQVIDWVKQNSNYQGDVKNGFCLVSGQAAKIVRIHDQISGVNQKPAALASINELAYCSYGKDKGFNFPVGSHASFKYSTALNYLLRKKSRTKFRINDISFVCWAEKHNSLETLFTTTINDRGDDPDKSASIIKSLFNSIHNGSYIAEDGSDRFYVLGLAPNSARIMIRFWRLGTVGEISENIAKWFDDIDIIGRDKFGYPTFKKLLLSTVFQYKEKNIPPNLPTELINSLLTNTGLPETFIHALLRRIKAEKGNVNYHRACGIKAYLNRRSRVLKHQNRELQVTLNKDDKRIGYCLGRLFAVLEKLQTDALGDLNTTIGDKYYSSASCTPIAVFSTLIRLSNHHIKKLEHKNWRINARNNIGQIMELISEFPSHLNIEHQGLFAIGYYHQRQFLFTKKPKQGDKS